MSTDPGAYLFLALMAIVAGVAAIAPEPLPDAEARVQQVWAAGVGHGTAPAPGGCAWSLAAGHEQAIRLPPVLERVRSGALQPWLDGMAQTATARCQRTVRVLKA